MTDDDYALACDCGSVKFNLLKSNKYECAKCGQKHRNPAKIDIHILFDALIAAMRGDTFDPDYLSDTIENIAKIWGYTLDDESLEALYGCGPYEIIGETQ